LTLIEMLIVVGILVALATAVTPKVVAFAGYGPDAQMAKEQNAVSKGLQLMMVHKGITTITGETFVARNDWTTYPIGPAKAVPIASYLAFNVSTYYYCWDGAGQVTGQYDTAQACG